MPNFQFTYTRCTPHGRILEHISDTISAWTIKSAKHALVKRFGLQNGSPWRKITNGYTKTRAGVDERCKITILEN
ncbi:hypothetical protein F4009_05630 [Candidatus Poribacteria bacterium]|nr:hypothetical protein [Candidatus Poribacteria bacterium]MYH83506.1 hypothetical protein [Candidatus Poribacteria bacterium]MYK93468.1 hypothetical protein [Candidatus Poribacteria bacterium]